tara:strand:+ start:900 stop:1292 length:393 start_codon:yes stop_codon:yes gene_type:complete
MAVALTTLRTTIAAALANAGVWSTFSFPPSVILANSVIVAPGDPYLVPSNNSQASIACMANFKIICTVPYLDTQGNLNGIESTIVAVFNKLASSSIVFNITGASAPSLLDAPSGPMLTSDFSITVLTTWS